MSILKKMRKTFIGALPSPIKVDFNSNRGSVVQSIAPLPKEVFWDDSVPVKTTNSGIEFVTTPKERFDHLEGYPYASNYIELDGLQMHYVAEGPVDGPLVLLLHGQPTWSYLYRKMIRDLVSKGYRCIAPDLIGMGKSDKPIHLKYHTYDQHCADTLSFINQLGLQDITLFCQDWGSLIGMRLVGENPDLFARVVLANGDLPDFTEKTNPFYIPNLIQINTKIKGLKAALAKHSVGGMATSFQAWILFCLTTPKVKVSEIMHLATTTSLSDNVSKAYDAPFPSFIYCAAPRAFPSMTVGIRGQTQVAIDSLRQFNKPFLSLIGLDDRLLGRPSIQKKWINLIPGAQGQDHEQLEKANHFIQEDIGEIMADRVDRFIQKNNI